jgi:hypothetical protein
MKTTTLIALGTLTLTMNLATAADDGAPKEEGKERGRRERPEGKKRGEHPGGEAFKAFMKSQKAAGREHHMAQGKETKALIETLREGDSNAGCKALAEHRTTQHGENVEFMQGQQTAMLDFIKQDAAENEIPEEKVAERIQKMTEHMATRTEQMATRSQEAIAKLTELSAKENLTWEEVRKATKSMHPKRGGRGRKGEGKRQRGGKRQRNASEQAE